MKLPKDSQSAISSAEDQLLNVPDEQLEALAAYNLMVLDVDLSDGEPRYTEQELEEKYADFKKIIKSEEN